MNASTHRLLPGAREAIGVSSRRTSRNASSLAAVAALLVSMAAASPALAGARIVNGVNTQDYPTTGALLHSLGAITGNNARLQCSGTLIGCQTFLTAAHCVTGDSNPAHYEVYLQNSGLHAVTSVAYNLPYLPGQASGDDVAIVKLAAPVTGIDPTTFNSTHDLQALGAGYAGIIAGFGETSGSGNDYAIKRAGAVVTSACNTSVTGGEGDDVIVCFDYASPIGAPGTDSDTCYGDSGGPLFVDFSGTTEVVGVTSTGSSPSCAAPDHSWDSSVFHNAAWIATRLGADSTATCGGLPAVGDGAVTVQKDSGSLGAANLDDTLTVNITGSPTLVRFTLNGTDNATFNPNFFVKQGSIANAANYDCKADGASVFGACEFANPPAGAWSIFVQRAGGAGEYQVTTTIYNGATAVCGNDVAEAGEACDGSDLGTCPVGPCVACACPAPVCGNDVLEAGESCDGTADAACPGYCAPDCTCAMPTCGDNTLDAGEQCDGSADAACPGLCAPDCTCTAPTCGNNTLDAGEQCDGSADAACPGLCAGDCTCSAPACSLGDLYGLSLQADARRFSYKALLYDHAGSYAALDPRDGPFTLGIVDTGGSVSLAIPAGDAGWTKADPVRRKYGWKKAGQASGLARVKLAYKDASPIPYWTVGMRGKAVAGAGSLNLSNVLDFELGFDGTCHLESW